MELSNLYLEGRACLDGVINESQSARDEVQFSGDFKIRYFEKSKRDQAVNITNTTIRWIYYCPFKSRLEEVRNLKPGDVVDFLGEISIRERAQNDLVYVLHLDELCLAMTKLDAERLDNVPF